MGVDDFEVTHEAGVVAFLRKIGAAAGAGDGTGLRGRLVAEEARGGERVLHFAEGDEHALLVGRGGFVVGRAAAGEIGAVASALEEREVEARAEGPEAAVGFGEVADVGAGVTGGSGERDVREERGLGDTDAGAGCGEAAFGGGDIGTAREQVAGEAGGNGRRRS